MGTPMVPSSQESLKRDGSGTMEENLKTYALYNYTLKSGLNGLGSLGDGVGGEFFHLDFMWMMD